MKKYWRKYRINTIRLQGWDYTSEGMYFITFNTEGRICCFGNVENKKMVYNAFGQIVHDEWLKSFEIRKELFLDEFVVMSNHIHGIVIIKNPEDPDGRRAVQSEDDDDFSDEELNHIFHPNPFKKGHVQGFRPQPRSISTFLGGFKSAVVSRIDDYIDEHQLTIPKYNKGNLLWQDDYYDHVIRSESEYRRIKQYIINNPAKWDGSDYYPFPYEVS